MESDEAPLRGGEARGIGVAPVMSILHTPAENGDPRPVYLSYGNYAWDDVAFADEIESLESKLRLHVTYALVEPPEGLTEPVVLSLPMFSMRGCRPIAPTSATLSAGRRK